MNVPPASDDPIDRVLASHRAPVRVLAPFGRCPNDYSALIVVGNVRQCGLCDHREAPPANLWCSTCKDTGDHFTADHPDGTIVAIGRPGEPLSPQLQASLLDAIDNVELAAQLTAARDALADAVARALAAGWTREQIAQQLTVRPRTLSSLIWSWSHPEPQS